jgi:hypothetical protein
MINIISDEDISVNLNVFNFIRDILDDSLFQKTIREIFKRYIEDEIENYSL